MLSTLSLRSRSRKAASMLTLARYTSDLYWLNSSFRNATTFTLTASLPRTRPFTKSSVWSPASDTELVSKERRNTTRDTRHTRLTRLLGELDGALDFLEFGADESRPDLHELIDVGPKERQHHQPLAVLLAHLRCTMTIPKRAIRVRKTR